MNNYSDYDERWCDGHFCPRDCGVCVYREENRDTLDYIIRVKDIGEEDEDG